MEALVEMEIFFTNLVQNLGGWLEAPMQAFTFLGSEMFFLLVMPALYWSIDPVIGFRAGMLLIISGGLNSALKMFFHTPRPYWIDGSVKALTSETSFGLPSGHSQNSAAIWGMVAHSTRKRAAMIIAVIVVFLIGFSRIYLGVHFLHDVLTGWLAGILLVIMYVSIEKPVANYLKTKTLGFQLLAALLFSLFFILLGKLGSSIANNWPLPGEWVNNAIAAGVDAPDPFSMEGILTIAGVAFGFLAGYALWIKQYKQYQINGSALKRILRYIVGLIGIVILYFGLKLVLPEEPALSGALLRYLRYALIGFWVTYLAPWIFARLHLDM